MSTQVTFHPFPRLPLELRQAIWKLCVPHRVIDLDEKYQDYYECSPRCTGWQSHFKNARPPRLSRVCQESRAVCMQRAPNMEEVDVWPRGSREDHPKRYFWINPSNDIVHMNWWPWSSNDGETPECGECYIPDLLRVSHQGKPSITAELLYKFPVCFEPSYFSTNFYDSAKKFTVLEMLEKGSAYFVVLESISIHAPMELALANEPFGRLGEEIYVLVRPDERDRIVRFRDLWAAASPTDAYAKQSLERALDCSEKGLERAVEKWQYELLVFWLQFKCKQALQNQAATPQDFEGIWYPTKEGYPVGIDQEYDEGPGADWKGLFREDHPFVTKVIQEMPRFEPVILFRLCEQDCHKAGMTEHDRIELKRELNDEP